MRSLAQACFFVSIALAFGCSSSGTADDGGKPGMAGAQSGGASGSVGSGGNGGAAGSRSAAGGGGQASAGSSPGGLGGTAAGGRAGAGTAGATGSGAGQAGGAAGGRGGTAGAGAGGAASAGAGGSGGAGAAAGAGAGASGSSACDWSSPPANVAAWVNESWSSQLSNNIKTRKDWNLDHVMLNKGSLNLCVRWGATSAVPATVSMNLTATIERWFNDWFKALGSYGCFPYGNGISVKVTGWAVKPGQKALLSGVDSTIPVYTEVDGDGEPKCPDACSSFVHWDHQFASCPGGAANHSDYWLWFDDDLPGGGGAAAVGGDWGLRMPVKTFLDHFADPSFLICEHEMGHGFGFQDYYDWTASTPAGGSLMIVGSTAGKQSPTVGDTWLLRRTWKEMTAARGW